MQYIDIKTYLSDFFKKRNSEFQKMHKPFAFFHALPKEKSEEEHKNPGKKRIVITCCKAVKGKADSGSKIISVKHFGKFKKLYKIPPGIMVPYLKGNKKQYKAYNRKYAAR